ncbi:MAG: hypothetical protein GY696_30425, partial [Gammaproteobacteria bacterium]|nr:hypothetical protein [Gammaproteobacteria bacterium]
LRVFLALSNLLDLEIHQVDIQTAFLNGLLKEDIYMKQPEGYVTPGQEHLVCKLERSLYGLKQASRCWNSTMDDYLKSASYRQSKMDPCVYYKSVGGDLIMLALYVDDIMFATKNKNLLENEKKLMAKRFKLKDLGKAHYILGIQITRDRPNRKMWLTQELFLKNMLEKFGMADCKPMKTPQEEGLKLQAHTGDPVDRQRYQAAVGSINYAVTATRPDLAAALTAVNKYMQCPGKEHWAAVNRIFHYIQGTLGHGIMFDGSQNSEPVLSGFADADWGGDLDGRKSTSGYIFFLGGGPVSWCSKRQDTVALSTANAEYVAACQATQEAIWLRNLLAELGFMQKCATVIGHDNQASISMSKNPTNYGTSKHIPIKFHFIREQVQARAIELEYCKTEDMVADILTKGLGRRRFESLKQRLSVTSRVTDV